MGHTHNRARLVTLIAAILATVAVSIDLYGTQKQNEGITVDSEYGIFHIKVKSDYVGLNAGSHLLECRRGFGEVTESPSSSCTSKCTTKKAFVILAVIFVWLAVIFDSQWPNALHATENKSQKQVAVACNLFACASGIIVLALLGHEFTVIPSPDDAWGLCAYGSDGGGQTDIAYGHSFILLIVATILTGITGPIQAVMSLGLTGTFSALGQELL